MAADGPSWADQWGEGGIGAMGDHDKSKDAENEKKVASSNGLGKAKAAAMAGAQKVKSGTSMSLKWVKNKFQNKPSST
ncbi:hypothetical protein F511_15095 [Dorcoceras hygrometricum]|uniref:Uncharacterized protein n=1 Tax=Dorcoceras hygrometricum TaxID=472368 RepID=A0A2Z7BYS4_9LAMI|nr:hypothetical protein F511_15095 [Dorcoceras hygrometricum]